MEFESIEPIEGDRVLYVLPDGASKGEFRPGFVVKVWSAETVNLMVLTDAMNDGAQYGNGFYWATSIQYDAEGAPGTWHWPER